MARLSPHGSGSRIQQGDNKVWTTLHSYIIYNELHRNLWPQADFDEVARLLEHIAVVEKVPSITVPTVVIIIAVSQVVWRVIEPI